MTGEFSQLSIEGTIPTRWKVTSVAAIISASLSIGFILTSAGAKGEKLDAHSEKIKTLETLSPRVDKMEAKWEDVARRLGSIESKIDRLAERSR